EDRGAAVLPDADLRIEEHLRGNRRGVVQPVLAGLFAGEHPDRWTVPSNHRSCGQTSRAQAAHPDRLYGDAGPARSPRLLRAGTLTAPIDGAARRAIAHVSRDSLGRGDR